MKKRFNNLKQKYSFPDPINRDTIHEQAYLQFTQAITQPEIAKKLTFDNTQNN